MLATVLRSLVNKRLLRVLELMEQGSRLLSVEVASRWPEDQVEQALEIVGAVIGDAHDATVVAQLLNMNVGLKVFPKPLLDSASGGIVGLAPRLASDCA